MPVLGSNSSASAAGAVGKGYSIPKGSLDGWKAARGNHASAVAEVVIFGDSTTFGSGANQSWVQTLRALAIAAGYTDGGRGVVGSSDTALLSGESLAGYSSRTGFATTAGGYDFMQGDTFRSIAAADTVTFQGKGTKCRLHYGNNNTVGGFTYSIDGAAAITVEAYNGAGQVTPITPLLLNLGAEGTHTVAVTNLGGTVPPVPTLFGLSQDHIAGTIPIGTTYQYLVSAVNAGGETLPGASLSATVSGFVGEINVQYNRVVAATGYNIYRYTGTGSQPSSAFRLIQSVTDGNSSGVGSWMDTGSATPTSQAPALVTTATRSGPAETKINPEFFRGAGLVWHKQAISGLGMGSFWGPPVSNAANQNWAGYTALGIVSGLTPAYADSAAPASNAQGSHPTYRSPALAVLALGVNNQQGATDSASATAAAAAVVDGVGEFVRTCRSAGCDPLVVVPHYEYSSNQSLYAMRFRQAHWAAAAAYGAAIVDFNIALGPRNAGVGLYTGGPHLNQAGYDAEANFVWNNVLSQ